MTFVLSLWVTGFCGGHHFYLRRYFFGFVYLFTGGLCGIGYIIDICRVPSLVRRANKSISTNTTQEKTLDDAYLMWFPFWVLGIASFIFKAVDTVMPKSVDVWVICVGMDRGPFPANESG